MVINAPSPLEQIVARQDWRARLEREYAATAARLQAAYGRITPRLEQEMLALLATLPPDATAGDVRRLRGVGDLLQRIETDMAGFAAIARNESGTLQEGAIQLGLLSAEQMAAAQGPGAARVVAGGWLRPDPAAIEQLINYADSDAMRFRAQRFGEDAARNFSDTLISLVAQGKNPRAIAGAMTAWFAIPYSWAENQTRTAQLYSYRGANHLTFRANSDIIEDWMWRAALDGRTCLSCVAQHGTFHPLTEECNDHHRGRCAPIPRVRGTRWAGQVESGPDWFARQSPATQRSMMGPSLFEAYQRGRVDWRQMSQPYQDGVYGTMLRQATLGEMGIARAQRRTSSRSGGASGGQQGLPGFGMPQGTPVSGALALPQNGMTRELKAGVAAIDAVHGDGPLPTIPVEVAIFDPWAEGGYAETPEIVISPWASRPGATLIHETGHFLDQHGLSDGTAFASVQAAGGNGTLAGWYRAVDGSQAVTRLRAMQANPSAFSVTERGTTFTAQQGMVDYLLAPEELWARSYEQYIATRSGQQALLDAVRARQQDALYGAAFWTDEDYAPVGEAMDTVFRQQGWRS